MQRIRYKTIIEYRNQVIKDLIEKAGYSEEKAKHMLDAISTEEYNCGFEHGHMDWEKETQKEALQPD